jgi:hypothetical protein
MEAYGMLELQRLGAGHGYSVDLLIIDEAWAVIH